MCTSSETSPQSNQQFNQDLSQKLSSKPSADLPFSVVALYRFTRLPDYAERREPLHAAMLQHTVRGTLLLAEEGINGTIAGRHDDMQAFMAILQSQPGFETLSVKTAYCLEAPFYRSKVKLKREIVTMGVPAIDPLEMAGTYVSPKDWNALISDPEVLLVDTRNSYETAIGTFRGAVDPQTDSFRDFPEFVASAMDSAQHKKVAMYCTGGIRCEKSTAYLRQQGFEEVYHLDGGILRYLEEVPESESLWQGECFVFDNRVTVDHQLRQGSYDQCHACRMPISTEDKADERYRAGISCPHCFEATSEDRRVRLEQREKQMRLAKSRGQAHIGQAAAEALTLNRTRKQRAKSGDQPC